MPISDAEIASTKKIMRDCQREAYDAVADYLSEPANGRSFLATLPTGAGKTGLIALIAQAFSAGPVIVLSPRTAVCDQLRREVGGNFFLTRGVPILDIKKVSYISSEMSSDVIYIDTLQKASSLIGENLSLVQDNCGLLIVDEGHSEPAPKWGGFVRSIRTHKIIITATPYRNDLFRFEIDQEKNYCYTFKAALANGLVVSPSFEAVSSDGWVGRVKEWIEKNQDLKCIVKCANFDEIQEAKRTLEESSLATVSIHERFSKQDNLNGEYVSVPADIRTSPARVIIHQRKLDEGVDLPEAKMIVLTHAVSSGRELVQTVGRVVRAFADRSPVVLDISNGSNESLWLNYIKFDDSISTSAGWKKFVTSLDTAALITHYMSAFPDISYYGRGFRKKFDFDTFDPIEELVLPIASFCFMRKAENFSLAKFSDALIWRLVGGGELARLIVGADGFNIILSVRFDNSKYLLTELFFQPSIEVVIIREIGDMIAVFDSRSVNHCEDLDLGTRGPIEVDKLLRLASRSYRVRTREAHSRAIGTTRARADRVSLTGVDLESISVAQSNASYMLGVAKVDNISKEGLRESSYYLSTGSGRVSDQKLRDLRLPKIGKWLDDIENALSSSNEMKSALLASYSFSVDALVSESPISITIDFADLDADIEVVQNGRSYLITPGLLFVKVSDWALQVFGVRLSLSMDEKNSKLNFSSSVRVDFANGDAAPSVGISFLDWINKRPLKALYDNAVSYLDGKFYRVALPSEIGFDIANTILSKHLFAVTELQTISRSEKGRIVDGEFVDMTVDHFDNRSIFHLVDGLYADGLLAAASDGLKLMRSVVSGSDVVLCTDMSTEPADFIFSSPTKLCYFHIKCGDAERPRSSAGALAEVGGQAMKNIEYLVSKNLGLSFANRATILTGWPRADAQYSLGSRLRCYRSDTGDNLIQPNSDSSAIIPDALDRIYSRRASDACEKEVWIVAGRSFSYRNFATQMKRGSAANGESLQAFQLIMEWINVCDSADVKLRIFVSP